jgi:hypothetical protein
MSNQKDKLIFYFIFFKEIIIISKISKISEQLDRLDNKINKQKLKEIDLNFYKDTSINIIIIFSIFFVSANIYN